MDYATQLYNMLAARMQPLTSPAGHSGITYAQLGIRQPGYIPISELPRWQNRINMFGVNNQTTAAPVGYGRPLVPQIGTMGKPANPQYKPPPAAQIAGTWYQQGYKLPGSSNGMTYKG